MNSKTRTGRSNLNALLATAGLLWALPASGAPPEAEAPPAAPAAAAQPAAVTAPGDSLYVLPAALISDKAQPFEMKSLRGQPVVISMFYGQCPHVCPMLIRNVQRLVNTVPAANAKAVRVLLVSFDPEHDTPAFLTTLRGRHSLDDRVTLATGDEATVRALATVLDVRYRKLPDGGYGHTSVITVLDGEGRVAGRFEGGAPAPQSLADILGGLAAAPGAVLAADSAAVPAL